MVRVAIFDYGAGNIFSLRHSMEELGAEVEVVKEMDADCRYSGLVLPGVGNFDPALQSMRRGGLGRLPDIPTLGICLGMEAFFDTSEEGSEPGLCAIPGDIVMLPDRIKIPHMGWNNLEIERYGRLLDGIEDNTWVYFVHSYRAKPDSQKVVSASADYGTRIPAVIEDGMLYGTQFHPEKSGAAGRAMLKNFVAECAK